VPILNPSISPQFSYLLDPQVLNFEARVLTCEPRSPGCWSVTLDRSYFYPTGGGQEHDTGLLGPARVLEVYKEGAEPLLVHVVDQPLPPGPLQGRIDAERRLRHAQHHTAQHLLTQCFLRAFGLETLSANINGYSPSTLDLPAADLKRAALERVEDLANERIYAGLAVKAYFVTPQELAALPLRRPPTVTENIRIVEIEGYDYSACGGTHCPSTATIGLVKVLKAERQNDRSRVYFIAGWQALQAFRQAQGLVTELASRLSVQPSDLPAAVQRHAEQLRAAQKELQVLRLKQIEWEADRLVDSGARLGPQRVLLASFPARPLPELRALADQLRRRPGLAALLATYDGQKAALLATCAPGVGLRARELLTRLLLPGWRGGGDDTLAQGGGAVDAAGYLRWLETASRLLSE
jgi:alanyl-tRNA synthetase